MTRSRTFFALIAVAMLVILVSPALFAQPQTTEEIQQWLMLPWVLFGLMVFGSLISAVKQWSVARMDGVATTVGLGKYLSHIQELFITLGGNTIAFFLLVDGGNLNFISAVSIGYVLNSVADLNPMSTRSTSLTQ